MSVTFRGADLSAPISLVQGRYSDNTQYYKTEQFREIAEHADTVTVRCTSTDDLFAALSVVQSVNDARGANAADFLSNRMIRNLILPYIPGARQDRFNPTGDVSSTLKLVGELINSQHFVNVFVVDPHSRESHYHIHHLREISPEILYGHLPKDYTGVIVPDKGAVLRAAQAAGILGIKEFKVGSKVRDVSNGRLTGFDVEELTPGGHYIVIDDLCDGGGTFVGLGQKISEQGATADLFVTHGLFTKGLDQLHQTYKNIFTTNSVTRHFPMDNVFDVVTEMEKYSDKNL